MSFLKNKKVIMFDMDGTLIDSVGVWNAIDVELINRISENTQINLEDVQIQRDTMLRQFSKSSNPYLEYCAWLGNKYSAHQTPEEINAIRYSIAHNYLKNHIDYKENANVFIRKLKESGYILAIVSTTKRSNMDIYRTENYNIISKANIDDYFSLVLTREDAEEIKPSPCIYFKAMHILGAKPSQCLVIEDSLIGIEASKGAGIDTVAIYDKYSDCDRENINKLSDFQFDSYKELMQFMQF